MTGRRAAAVVAALFTTAFAERAGAQGVQPEFRLDALVARSKAFHAAAGVNAVTGSYARLTLLGGAGARRVHGQWRSSGRFDAVARVHFDPLRQYAWGAYAGGGATVLFEENDRARGRFLVVVGYEGPATSNGWIAGVEVGVGGGVRIAVIARRARDVGR